MLHYVVEVVRATPPGKRILQQMLGYFSEKEKKEKEN